jgi:hypothetical protein
MEFKAAKSLDDNVVLTESPLDGVEVAIAFRPRAVMAEGIQAPSTRQGATQIG